MAAEGGSFWRSRRFCLACVAFLGFANLYALRVNISFATAYMAADINQSVHNSTLATSADLTKRERGLVLGSFFVGYMITQIPGGILAERFGGKNVFLWPMCVAALATLICPLAASIHFTFLMAVRVVIGLCEGVVFPAMHAIWSHWAPPLERSKLTGFSYAGCQIGNVGTLTVAGMLCAPFGWQSLFYVFGTLGVLWCILWWIYASNSPEDNKDISDAEREYITCSLTGQVKNIDQNSQKPWLKIFTSAPVWAIIVAHTSANFGTYLVLTSLPAFMKEVLHFDIKSNGIYSALLYVAFWIGINIASFLADFLIQKMILNTTHVRKLMMLIALLGQGGFFIATGHCQGDGYEMQAVALLSAAQGISGFQFGGFVANHLDIAPRYAGTLFGLSNTVATVSGILAPIIASSFTPDGTAEQWRIVFNVAASVLFFGAIFYLLFGSGKLQSWAAVPTEPVYSTAPIANQSHLPEEHQNQQVDQEEIQMLPGK